jgi:hypothetical protein
MVVEDFIELTENCEMQDMRHLKCDNSKKTWWLHYIGTRETVIVLAA